MARPRSDDKRNAIVAAAIRVIHTQGLHAPTVTIAKEAGVSSGTLFVYFKTKADLFNHLYLEVKTGMATAAMREFPEHKDLRSQFFQVWKNWMDWAVTCPDQKHTMILLAASDEITPQTRAEGHRMMASITGLIEKIRSEGSMRDTPTPFVDSIINSIAESTMDFMISDKLNAEGHCKSGFEAVWRVLN